MSDDFYAVLGVPRECRAEAINKAYRKKALELHPDRVAPDLREQAHSRFVELGRAYSILSDPGRRAAYDAGGAVAAGAATTDAAASAIFEHVFGSPLGPAPPFFGKAGLLLGLAIAVDAIGVCSFALPVIGEFFDVLWAPASAFIIRSVFQDTALAGLNFLEELLPGLDFIPTACIAWARQYGRFVPKWLHW
jgi:curved DNA-binding protein CbpA